MLGPLPYHFDFQFEEDQSNNKEVMHKNVDNYASLDIYVAPWRRKLKPGLSGHVAGP